MRKSLVFGAAGFVGGHLLNELLLDNELIVYATKLNTEFSVNSNVEYIDIDILCKDHVLDLLRRIQPDEIYYLIAQSSVKLSWEKPEFTIDVNINGVLNLLEAIKHLKLSSRILLVGSSEEYGVIKNDSPIKENQELSPANIYAATKVFQEYLAKIYHKAYGLNIIMTRSFNHIGPNQDEKFVVSSFCKQIVEIEKNPKDNDLHVGNLHVARDFTDVRDVVKAYVKLMQLGKSGEVYNVASGKIYSLVEILEKIVSFANVHVNIIVDDELIRPVENLVIRASIDKIHKDTNWLPAIKIEDSLIDVLNYWRVKLH